MENEQSARENRELIVGALERIASDLGFKPDAGFKELCRQLRENTEKAEALMHDLLAHGQHLIDQMPEQEKISAQIGLVVYEAAALYSAGLKEHADDALEQAIGFAYEMELGDLAMDLEDSGF